MVNVKELSDKDLIKLYKKNSTEPINIIMLLNIKENIEIVQELKKRGLFKNLERQKEFEEEINKLSGTINNNLQEENIRLNKELEKEKEKTKNLNNCISEYLIISTVLTYIDKGEYFRKRDFTLSNSNIEELEDLYRALIDNLNTYYKTDSITKIDISDIIDYSSKYLDENYKEKESEEEDEAPVEGMKHFLS